MSTSAASSTTGGWVLRVYWDAVGIRVYLCPFCGEKFIDFKDYWWHMRRHLLDP